MIHDYSSELTIFVPYLAYKYWNHCKMQTFHRPTNMILKLLALAILFCSKTNAEKVLWQNQVELDLDELTSHHPGLESLIDVGFTFPFTKWCGPGDTASNGSDLGKDSKVDKCCRAHDHCSTLIPQFDSEYDLQNIGFFTRLNCSCDISLYKCLQETHEVSADVIGFVYFTLRGAQCFQLDHPISGCRKYITSPRRTVCVEYEVDQSRPKKYQWFDVPEYKMNFELTGFIGFAVEAMIIFLKIADHVIRVILWILHILQKLSPFDEDNGLIARLIKSLQSAYY